MIIRVLDQSSHLDDYLKMHQRKSVAVYNRDRLKNKSNSIRFPFTWSKREAAESLIFNYLIFPKSILVGYGEWCRNGRMMQVGDTIVQQAYLPPGIAMSQKLIFGARVNKVWRNESDFGFAYETLEGHPELGESNFNVRQDGTHCIFTISTISAPGNILSQIVAPIFTLPYQSFCTRKALENIKSSFSLIQ